ncbi:MAG: ZIP family metal transporter [Gammaproteobacteria bacterium]|nr:ZIP family metal transporter [Gammaproteobacteria bacterium]
MIAELEGVALSGAALVGIGFAASLLAGMCTFVGALPVLLVRTITERTQNLMLGFGAGVMMAASIFSLILPALDVAADSGIGDVAAVSIVILGLLLGAVSLSLVHHYAPHEHFIIGHEGPPTARLARVWLFIIAITLHNFPEGLAVGVGFGGGNVPNGIALAIGIGLQNMPEGLVVAVALISQGYTKGRALWVSLLTGLVEPVGGLIGVVAVTLAQSLLPWALAFSAGAMIFVISDEIIPETHRSAYATQATFSLMIGFAVMMFLDVTLS